MSDQDVDDMIAEIDKDSSGTVDYEEFKAVMKGENEWDTQSGSIYGRPMSPVGHEGLTSTSATQFKMIRVHR